MNKIEVVVGTQFRKDISYAILNLESQKNEQLFNIFQEAFEDIKENQKKSFRFINKFPFIRKETDKEINEYAIQLADELVYNCNKTTSQFSSEEVFANIEYAYKSGFVGKSFNDRIRELEQIKQCACQKKTPTLYLNPTLYLDTETFDIIKNYSY